MDKVIAEKPVTGYCKETSEEKQKREWENKISNTYCKLPPMYQYIAVKTKKEKK